MIERNVEIINKLGLHARAAAKFVQLASRFESSIHIRRSQKEVNGKSIMGVMMLAASKGTEVTLIIDGQDEDLAVVELEKLINDCFGEPE